MNKSQAVKLCVELGLDSSKLVNIGDGMFTLTSPASISASVANAWLKERNTENRKPKSTVVSRVKNDIVEGCWHVTHQGIAFRDDGILGDGQNRLFGIVHSGKSAKVRIFFGLTKEAMLAIDSNAPRTSTDTINLDRGEGFITAKKVSVLKFFIGGYKGALKGISSELLIQQYELYQEELDFVINQRLMDRKFLTAPVIAVIMRAYYNVKNDAEMTDKLVTFCEWISTGKEISSSKISKFRDECLIKQNYGGQGRKAVYTETQKILYGFMYNLNHYNAKQFRNPELFLLDHEKNIGGEEI